MEDFIATCRRVTENKARREFPGADDRRHRGGVLFPAVKPRFRIDFGPGVRVFTIGSCFARNVEDALEPLGVDLPTKRMAVPKSETSFRANGILNEYNIGCIGARVAKALDGIRTPPEVIIPNGALFADLSLSGAADVTFERALERQEQIFRIYEDLPDSDVVIITLGMTEAWYDKLSGSYLNRMPPYKYGLAHPDRFAFVRFSVEETTKIVSETVEALCGRGKKVVLSVSPVPMNTTFTGSDCVVANEYSKAVLRVCAEQICMRYDTVDYFPSYEIVRSAGLASAFAADNIHVKDALVREITAYMVECYRDA